MIKRRYVPEWCGTHDQKGYAEFRSAFTQYQAFMVEADDAITDAFGAFNTYMCGTSAAAARNPLMWFATPNLMDANDQVTLMLDALKGALKGHPREATIAAAIKNLRPNVEKYQQSRMRLESIADEFEAAPDPAIDAEPCEAASLALAGESVKYVEAGQTKNRLVREISTALSLSDELCEGVEVSGPVDNKVTKAGTPTTKKSGGAGITFPKTLEIGKRPVKLPVTLKSPVSSYGSIEIRKGSKGIVATGGQVTQGSFGLLLTIPKKTKEGKVTLTFALQDGPRVKGTIRLV